MVYQIVLHDEIFGRISSKHVTSSLSRRCGYQMSVCPLLVMFLIGHICPFSTVKVENSVAQ